MASLHVAVLFGNEKLTRTLLEEGYDPNVYDERLGTPLSIAILKGYRSIVKLLSEKGADHNNKEFTSALVHSRIDEFNLPNADRSESTLRGCEPGADDRETEWPTESAPRHDNKTNNIGKTGLGVSKGSISETKTLFRNGYQWQETPTGKKAPAGETTFQLVNSVHQAYAVVLFMEQHDEGGWQPSKIDIHGSKLCGFLSRVLKNYPGAGIGHSRATIDFNLQRPGPDFMGLFHRMERYIKLSEEEVDPITETQAQLLLQSLETLFVPLKNIVEDSRTTGVMVWAHLWLIYQPGNIAIIKLNGNEPSAARILEVKLDRPWRNPLAFQVTVEVADWNGSYSGYREKVYRIETYDGVRKLIDLGIYPLPYHPGHERLKKRLVQRGRKFESLRGYYFMSREAFNVTRRVIIDNYAYHRFNGGYVPKYARMGGQSSVSESDSNYKGHARAATEEPVFSRSYTENVRPICRGRDEDLRPLTDDECLLCVPTMKGFDIQEKEWGDVQVDGLESIPWGDEAFKHLAIQEDRKRLVLAFTEQKQIEVTEFDDFITGKGKSFIVLLCGPPGVGKTLTAESVAEHTKAPLYTLSAGDLGTNAVSVERALKKALEMCALWRAVMLIDEADVFLEARKTDNLKRNEVVSVFLRLLEYYKGILFLTTNRVTSIDSAFESRVDLIIPYDDFDQATRRQVWANFADRLVGGTHELRDTDFDQLSQEKLNGREIKSTLKTGLMLANNEKKKLQMEHLKIVLDVRRRATGYLHPECVEEVLNDGKRLSKVRSSGLSIRTKLVLLRRGLKHQFH